MAHALSMVHAEDPKTAIKEACAAALEGIHALGARVLVGVYVRPEQTKSGIILPQQTTNEDRYQGKVGLVLALGPIAFQDDATHRFGRIVPKVGDWVVFRVGDTFAMELGTQRVRSVEDVDVHLITDNPDCVW